MTSSSLSASLDYSVTAAQTLNATNKFQHDWRPNSIPIGSRRSWLQLDGRFRHSGPVVCQTLVGLFILKFCPSLPSTHARTRRAGRVQTNTEEICWCLSQDLGGSAVLASSQSLRDVRSCCRAALFRLQSHSAERAALVSDVPLTQTSH